MFRSSMQTSSGNLRPAPDHIHSAQPRGPGREHALDLREYIHPISIDDRERRALRARAKFTWTLTDKGLSVLECHLGAYVASPVTWALLR